MHAQHPRPPSSDALRFDELQASMALFAEAIHGRFVRLDAKSDKSVNSDPGQSARTMATPELVRIVLRDRYEQFASRSDNLGACRVDILRQLIVLPRTVKPRIGLPYDVLPQSVLPHAPMQKTPADPDQRRDLNSWGELPTRIFLALQAMCRDSILRRDFPGACADLDRAIREARAAHDANPIQTATRLQNTALHRIEEWAIGQVPLSNQSPFPNATHQDGDAHFTERDERTLRRVLRIAQACAHPDAQLKDCLPRTLHIGTLLGLQIPEGLITVEPISLADNAMLQEEGTGETTPTQAGKEEDGDAQNQDEHPSSADGGELSRRHGLPGETTAQVPDFFELKGADNDKPQPDSVGDTGQPRLAGRPEARTLRSFLYPEWHFEERRYWPAWCRVHEHRLRGENSLFINEVRKRHGPLARAVRQRLAAIRPNQLQRVARNLDGEEPDLEAVINRVADRRAGRALDDRLYVQRQRARREVSAAFLVDMSGSTNISMPSKAQAIQVAGAIALEDTAGEDWPYLYGGGMFAASDALPPMRRVIDVAKDALAMMCDGLQGLGDRFAVYGFSGDGRKQVDFYIAKEFDEALSGRTWAALSAIEPKRSSRLGPAIRHAVHKFRGQSDVQRLLIIISDGYPQDSDYGPQPDDVEYGIQDSGRAIAEAEKAGIHTFFITIDPAGLDYMGRICNERSSMLIDDIADLPLALSKVYGGLRRR